MAGSGSTYDGSSFDFGYQPHCKSEPNYPWCPGIPDYCGDTSVVMHVYQFAFGKRCWAEYSDSGKCAALCKKRLD
ncbi:hypothetical protein AAVH_08152 [Aphelenchoides avenae]|nr:hypothetical protein AAVH_08152 [Aphelenchus avenae]